MTDTAAGRERPVSELVSPEEWEARVDLAACYRLVELYGMTEMTANHISARVPGAEGEFLINPYGMLYEEVTASCLIRIDLEGGVLFNATEYGVNRAGYVIHSAVHQARPDVACVIHTHTVAGMAVSAMACGLLPIAQTSMRFGEIGYHDYEGVALELDERERLVRDLGHREAMVLRNHGLLVVGASIPEAFNNAYRLERACQVQVAALACNVELRLPPEEVVRATNRQYEPGVRRRFGLLEWPALLRKLDRVDPSYRE
ncbi:MAG TPA: class II aldolase/adducin family protein [Methylomirabilota bacterium]|nr:class II aldolase/adducin family protein [Methylomirabilota bacterium]